MSRVKQGQGKLNNASEEEMSGKKSIVFISEWCIWKFKCSAEK